MGRSGELESIAPGYYIRPGDLDDTIATWASIELRKPSTTICLLSALSLHGLTDEIPAATDIELPRGERTLTTRSVSSRRREGWRGTPNGRVLPINGVKQKLPAAELARLTTVFIPACNEFDPLYVSAEILAGLDVRPVADVVEVRAVALEPASDH